MNREDKFMFFGFIMTILFLLIPDFQTTDETEEYKFCIVQDFQTTECKNLVRAIKEQYVIKEVIERK